MNTSVSPLPLPLWPLVALSLTLFAVTAVSVTVSGHFTTQLYAQPNRTLETTAPTLAVIRSAHLRQMF